MRDRDKVYEMKLEKAGAQWHAQLHSPESIVGHMCAESHVCKWACLGHTHSLIHTYHYAYSVVNCLELPGFGSK